MERLNGAPRTGPGYIQPASSEGRSSLSRRTEISGPEGRRDVARGFNPWLAPPHPTEVPEGRRDLSLRFESASQPARFMPCRRPWTIRWPALRRDVTPSPWPPPGSRYDLSRLYSPRRGVLVDDR